MAVIRSFKGLRYNTDIAGDLNSLVCPPYDIISDAQREEFINENVHNIIRLEKPVGENCYDAAAEELDKWLNSGVLVRDDKSCIYVYEMEFSDHGITKSLKGFVPIVRLEEFSEGIILPHEETLSKAKVDRFNLMKATNCNFSQIYSLYMDEDGSVFRLIDGCSAEAPDMEVTDENGTIHRMWCVYDEVIIAEVEKLFEYKKLYIADGHHRYETALNYHKYLCENGLADDSSMSRYIPMMLVNIENDGLVVHPTHRIVSGIADFDEAKLLKSCEDYFNITDASDKSDAKAALRALYEDGENAYVYYSASSGFKVLTLKDKASVYKLLPGKSDAYVSLDVSVLHSLILEKLLGIDKENMANQKNLTYTRSFTEAVKIENDGEADCVFILNPTRVTEIRDVALAGEKMPQKSTYFYPKLITGLVMNKFM